MFLLAQIAVILVGILHLGFLVLEMFLWDKPTGLRIFGQTKQQAVATKVLAANQGLYNGFLSAGLFWGLSLGSEGVEITIFFLCCVIAAGIFGALTASRTILYVQAIPAVIALLLVVFQ